ncbi:MAG: helix-turn-helix domain-containing protein [Firmicutes bacterium]|nr:helix-turn-helix domain-containing protein [Bacillota bacterium]
MREREDNQKRNSGAPAPFTAPLGTILSVLRLGRGLGREELSRQLNLNASYVARLERGDRQPSPKTLSSWLAACPVPVLPIAALTADLPPWPTDGEREPSSAKQDWTLVHLSVSVSGDEAVWAEAAAHALHWSTPDILVRTIHKSPDLLGSLLWLNVRAGRYHHLPAAASITAESLHQHNDVFNTSWIRSEWYQPLWEALTSMPVEPTSSQPADILWDRMAQLWPMLPFQARQGLVAAAEAWSKPGP